VGVPGDVCVGSNPDPVMAMVAASPRPVVGRGAETKVGENAAERPRLRLEPRAPPASRLRRMLETSRCPHCEQ
jgi:hypothetical protein